MTIVSYGNTYVVCHTAANGGGGYKCTEFSDSVTGKKTNSTRSLFLNCYSEKGQQSEINAPSVVLGGMGMNVLGTAIWLDQSDFVATFINGARGLSRGTSEQPSTVATYLGSPNLNGVALELHRLRPNRGSDSQPYRLHYGLQRAGWWELSYANGVTTPLRFSTPEAPEGGGNLWMANGYFIGSDTNRSKRVRVQASNSHPDSGDSRVWQKGDRILNSDPAGGEYSGWICTESGSPGTWKGFGLIEQ